MIASTCSSRCVSTPTTKSSPSAIIRPILRLHSEGPGSAGLSARKPQRQDCDESRPQGGQAPDQASSGRQTGAAVPPGQIIPKARNAASHPTSHKQHGDTRLATAPDRPTQRVPQSPEQPP